MRQEKKKIVPNLQAPGGEIPALGLGTWSLKGEEGIRAIQDALEIGYRHIDTAEIYDTEREVGEATRRSKLAPESIFVVTKVHESHLDRSGVKQALKGSLKKLKMDCVDLLLIHAPSPEGVPLPETLGAMNELIDERHVKHIGVSNFSIAQMQEAQGCSDAPIFCNQVEYHPYVSQQRRLDYCRANGILLVAYSPLALNKVLKDATLTEIGRRYGKNAAQVALRWLVQQPGVAAIPRSHTGKHMQENFEVFDFELSNEEMTCIFELGAGKEAKR